MELNSNPNLPNSNGPVSGSSEPASDSNRPSPQIFSRGKVITPLNSNIQPEEPATPPRVATGVNNQSLLGPSSTSPVYPSVDERAAKYIPQPEPEWKRPDTLRRNVLEALTVFGIAALAGSLFHLWHKLAASILPNAVSVCSNASHDVISFACHGTLLGNFFAFITLFSLASYITFLIFKKGHFLAYYYAGLLVSLLSFFSIALAFETYAALKFQWLIPSSGLWRAWFIPGLASGGLAVIIYAITKYTNALVRNVLSAIYVVLFLGSLIFVPGLVRNYVSDQDKVTPEEANQLVADYTQKKVKESSLTLYTITGSNVPVKITDVRPLLDSPNTIPRYDIFYSLNRTGKYGGASIETRVFKASTAGYNPPTNCTDSLRRSSCKLLRTTKKGTQIYGSDNTVSYMQKLRPYSYYVAFEDIAVSIKPVGELDLVTNDVLDQFIDSLAPLTGTELERFTSQHLTPS